MRHQECLSLVMRVVSLVQTWMNEVKMQGIENRKFAVEQDDAPASDRSKVYPMLKTVNGVLAPNVQSSPEELSAWMDNLKGLLGTQSDELATALLSQLLSASSKGNDVMNGITSLLCDLAPRDMAETLVISQIIVCHFNCMRIFSKAQNMSDISSQERYISLGIRLQKTFLAQIEALKRYRSSGKQTIVVERVSVSQGGQAVIGSSIRHGGGE